MPQKMIYVAEADLPLFERAQQLAGSNLSAVIARALRQFVETEEAKSAGSRPITVAVGTDGQVRRQQFRGRLLARHREHTPDDTLAIQLVYQTAKGKLAVYTKTIAQWSSYSAAEWERWDWSTSDYRLDVYDTLDALKPQIPAPLFATVVRRLGEDATPVEILDI